MKIWPNNYEVLKSGVGFGSSSGIVTSGLYLAGNPVQDLEAAPKQYVDSITESIPANKVSSGTFNIERLPAYSGEVVSAQGTGILSLVPTGVTAGTYSRLSVTSTGRVNSGAALSASDVPGLSWSKIASDKPTSLAGYGITDGLAKTGGVLTGYLTDSVTPTQPLMAVNKDYVDTRFQGYGPVQTGGIIKIYQTTTPSGFLRCNGGLVSKADYPNLYVTISGDQGYWDGARVGAGQPWRQQYEFNTTQTGNITGWTTGTSLPGALVASQAVVTQNRVYLLGGTNGGSSLSTVYTAPINGDGTLGAWTTGTSLPGAVHNSQAVVTQNRVYLLGGWSGSPVSTVYTAPINADGTLGTWTTGTSLPVALSSSQAVVTKNRVYLLGGNNDGSLVSTVYTAPINADGTLGTWTTGTSLPVALSSSQAVVTKNRVYLLGGNNGIVYTTAVYTAPINTDGTLGTWTTGTSLPGALVGSQAIVTKNRVYLTGGENNGGVISTVYTASINADGTLGTWTTGTSLPGAMVGSQAVVTQNRVYLLGGRTATIYIAYSYTAPFSGGLNDYTAMYYPVDASTYSNSFTLPDYTYLETSDLKYYIKY